MNCAWSCISINQQFLCLGQWRAMTLPDRYIDHGSQIDQIEVAGLSSKHVAATALSLTNVQWDSRQLLSLQI